MHRLKKKLGHIAHMKRSRHSSINTKTGYTLASLCASLVPARDVVKSSGQSNTCIIQDFVLVWLDTEINTQTSYYTTTLLRHIINNVNTFTDLDECIEYINSIKDEQVFLIVSGEISQRATPNIHDIPQINSIYIFCENKFEHESWIHKWSKIKGAFNEFSLLCEAVKQAIQEYDRNTSPISFIQVDDEIKELNLDKIDQSFVYTQILKEIISTIDCKKQDNKEFINYYRKQTNGNSTEQKNIDKFEQEYHDYGPIRWYTSPCFLQSMLKRSLRTMDSEILIKMGLFLYDLDQHIIRLHTIQNTPQHDKSSFIVYRGQGISQTDFDRLKTTQNGFISFDNFLFTGKNHQMSLDLARKATKTSDLIGILFAITINPLISSIPYANIRDVTCVQTNEEILFPLHSIFRIDQIKQINNNNNRLWQVELTLIDNNDFQLNKLIEFIRDESFFNRKGWCRLIEFLIKQGQFIKAQQICETLIGQTSDSDEKGLLHYQLGLSKFHREEYREAKSSYYSAIEIWQNTLSIEHADLAACYHDLAVLYEKLENNSKALLSYQKAFEIYKKILPAYDSQLATCNNNIGRIYSQLNEYSKSIFYFEQALEIYQNILPLNNSNIINGYNNIGLVYDKMGEYQEAIVFLERTLSIQKKILPLNHIDMADLYNNIGSAYEKMGEFSIAVSYYEKSLEIYEENLPSDHPDLAACLNRIGFLYFQKNNYIQALTFLEKSHEIYQKILPDCHTNLAGSYACQGAVYEEMGKYSKALSYYKKALEIYRNIQPINYLDLAMSYTSVGSVYFQMDDYASALSYHEKALDVYQKHLPPNHPDLANLYSSQGDTYHKIKDYTKSIEFYKRAVDIAEITLPENHPCIEQWKDNIAMIKKKI